MIRVTTLKLEMFSLPVHTLRLNHHKREHEVSFYTSLPAHCTLEYQISHVYSAFYFDSDTILFSRRETA
jgi:hypothetical protein